MTDPMPGGRRRIDRVLGENFLADLQTIPLEELRARRRESEQEEADLSYIRRLLHARLDLVRAELGRRENPDEPEEPFIARLARILADPARGEGPTMQAAARVMTVEPSRIAEHRRRVEQIVADVGLSDVEARTVEELTEAVGRLETFEEGVSTNRRAVQHVVDALSAEVGRRYRDGAVRAEDTLSHHS